MQLVAAMSALPVYADTDGPQLPAVPTNSGKAVANSTSEVWLAHRLVVAPLYPTSLAVEGVTGSVSANLRVSPKGELLEILSIASTPNQPEFVAAVRTVLPRWRFRKEVDERCEPRESMGWLRVFFNMKDGRPRVSVSRPPNRLGFPVVGHRSTTSRS